MSRLKPFLIGICIFFAPFQISSAKANIFDLIREIIEVGKDISTQGANIANSIQGVNQTISINADILEELLRQHLPELSTSLRQIGSFASCLNGILENPTTQVTVYIVTGAVSTAAIFYVGNCIYKIGKKFCNNSKYEKNPFSEFNELP